MKPVFVSYSRQNEDFARRLAADLSQMGASVWLDVDSIPSGVNWSNAIQQGLDRCEILILILSPAALESKNVEEEWQYFRDENKLIVPVRWQPVDKIHFQLRRIQWVDFLEQPYAAALDELRTRLAKEELVLAPDANPLPPPSARQITARSARHIVAERELSGHRDAVRDIDFSPDGELVVTCSEDKIVRLYSTGRRRTVRNMIGHEKAVNAISFSPSGTFLASASDDRTVRLWHVVRRYCITALFGHRAPVNNVAYNPTGALLASAGDDGSLRLWDTRSFEQVALVDEGRAPLYGLAFSPDGRYLLYGGLDGDVSRWNVGDRHLEDPIETPDFVRAITFNRGGDLLALGLDGSGVHLLDAQTHDIRAEIRYADYNANCVRGMEFSPDGSLLAMATTDGNLRLWKLDSLLEGKTSRALRTLKEHEGGLCDVAFSPDGAFMATASHDATARVWHLKPG